MTKEMRALQADARDEVLPVVLLTHFCVNAQKLIVDPTTCEGEN